jgi:N-acetyl-anhydromuramyl-L-alanine amidase AmpD
VSDIPFVRARHYAVAGRKRVDLIVLHSAEIGESLDGAEAIARGFARQRFLHTCPACKADNGGAPSCPKCGTASRENKSSAHFSVDADSIVQSVRETDIANHAPGVNPVSIGIEMAGRARQTAAEWDDDFSRSVIARTAKLTAAQCKRWDIPIVFVPSDALLRWVRGITLHSAVSEAFKRSNHRDPGEFFPLQRFLDLVITYSHQVA